MVDVAVVGAGAAGLMAGIWAGRTGRCRSVLLLDGARTLGAKILVSGGGRCNVTHDVVEESAYAGSSRHAIRKVLRRFDAAQTVAFFRALGVELKREETGKLFPVTDRARTVLDALLLAARQAGAEIRHPWRVESVERGGTGFRLEGPAGTLEARRLILATGGMALPKSGSDGQGYELAKSLGHTLTPQVFPALVALTLAEGCYLRALSGITLPARLEVRSGGGRRLAAFTDSTLCTHFGISGPAAMDISRHLQAAQFEDPQARLFLSWLPEEKAETLDARLRDLRGQTVLRFLVERLPERLARAVCAEAGVDPATAGHALARERRRALVAALVDAPLPVTGNRGFAAAETTAGGVPLAEVRVETMESRCCPGLHLCGEILDVDGRIGGYSFQWAWASGHVAGISVAP